jgi:hypothetical protein
MKLKTYLDRQSVLVQGSCWKLRCVFNLFDIFNNSIVCCFQLKPYYKPDTEATQAPTANWADQTLGRRRHRAQATPEDRTLGTEINNYMRSEREKTTNLVQWWVVRKC